MLLLAGIMLISLAGNVTMAGGDKVHGELGVGSVVQVCNNLIGECMWDDND